MTTFANIVPAGSTDGIPYCTNVPLTTTEAELGDGLKSPAPFGVEYGDVIAATVQLSINGYIVSQQSYVVMQTDMGDGVWIDLAWTSWTGNQGTVIALLGGSGIRAINSFTIQTRQPGQFPSPPGASGGIGSGPMGGRVRFVGQAIALGGSSSLAGTAANVLATIKYKKFTYR